MDKLNAPQYYRNLKKGYILLDRIGTLKAVTKVNNPAKKFENCAPYKVGIIELEDGEIVYAQVIDAVEGEKVIGCLRKIKTDGDAGLIHYGIKFRKV